MRFTHASTSASPRTAACTCPASAIFEAVSLADFSSAGATHRPESSRSGPRFALSSILNSPCSKAVVDLHTRRFSSLRAVVRCEQPHQTARGGGGTGRGRENGRGWGGAGERRTST